VVTEDGTVRRYFGLDGEFTSFSLGNVRWMSTRAHDLLNLDRVQKSTV
jgi:hypothetical protein